MTMTMRVLQNLSITQESCRGSVPTSDHMILSSVLSSTDAVSGKGGGWSSHECVCDGGGGGGDTRKTE